MFDEEKKRTYNPSEMTIGSVTMILKAMVVTNLNSCTTDNRLDPRAMSTAFSSTLPLLLTALEMTTLGRVSGTKHRMKEKAPAMMMLM